MPDAVPETGTVRKAVPKAMPGTMPGTVPKAVAVQNTVRKADLQHVQIV